jgi:uncharacterized protein (TIGR03435 family)
MFTAVLFGSHSAWALPKPGTPAPPLQFTQLLQAPPGARTDWAALRGKVVVLEFWATWCGPRVTSIPHLNQLAASLDPARFQFISVDDEYPKVVQEFLTKRKMAGWAGIDTTGGVFKRYGVEPRPTTIIVNQEGRIVAATQPDNLTVADLVAVADGESVKFSASHDELASKDAKVPVVAGKAPAARAKPLYLLALNEASSDPYPAASCGFEDHDGLTGGIRAKMYMRSTEKLLSVAYNDIPEDRFLSTSPLPEGPYDLCISYASANSKGVRLAMAPFLQAAITYGLNLRVESKTVTMKAYVLKATGTSKTLLIPQPPIQLSKGFYEDGKVYLINGSVDDLATALENGLEIPVVNETGVEGRFDAELEFPAKDVNAAKAALLKALGLELIQEDRPIQMLEVSPREDPSEASESNPQPAPKP